MKQVLLLFIFCLLTATGFAQEFIPLWQGVKKPNWNGKVVTDSVFNERIWRVGTPGMFAFLVAPSENKGSAVLICPGGGYERVSHVYNGFNFAKWFNSKGINVFVLVYRLPHQQDLINKQEGPVTDAQRAMKVIRANSAQWRIKQDKIGVMGISAGGHVATSLATASKDIFQPGDSLKTVGFSPDFSILLSPVITMGEFAHSGSRRIFLGVDSSKKMVEKYSNHLQVAAGMAPVFLVHAQNDSSVNIKNSLLYYSNLIDKGIQASLHTFPQGGHGIGLVDNPGSTALWLNLLELWLHEKGFMPSLKK